MERTAPPGSSFLSSAGRLKWLICLVLVLGTAAVYWPVGHFEFVDFDDQVYLLNNFNINRGLSWAAFKWAFNAGYAGNWHPLTWLSYGLECSLFGLNPGVMHVTNALLHAATSAILFLALAEATGKVWRSGFVAALFAWHPMHVESVAWIAERKDVLSGFFFVLTLWAYVRYVKEFKARGSKPRILSWYGWALVFFALGLMAKPMLVTLPCVLLLLDFWPLGRASGPQKAWLALAAEKVPFFFLAAVSSALTLYAQAHEGAVRTLQEMAPGIRVINALVSYFRYTDKLAWPKGLNAVYQYDFGLPTSAGVWAGLSLVIVCAAAFWLRQRSPYLLVGWLWFVGMLAPVIGIVQVGGMAMADRYSYLPSIGLFIAVTWLAADLAGESKAARNALATAGAMAAGACLWLTAAQAMTWRDGIALSRRCIGVDPANFVAHAQLAAEFLNRGRLDEARQECIVTLKLNPNFAPGHEYLGDVLYLTGDYAGAAAELGWAVRHDPFKHAAVTRLGEVYLALGQPEAASDEFRNSLSFDSKEPAAHCGLGRALAMQGELEEARREFEVAIQTSFADPEAHYELGETLTRMKQNAQAIQEFQTTLRYAPNHVGAMNNLAWLLTASPDPALRNGTNAVALAQRACVLTTNSQPLFIGTLAAAYAEAGRFDDAVAAAQKAHDVALAQTNAAVAARNLQLLDLYRGHKPYHDE